MFIILEESKVKIIGNKVFKNYRMKGSYDKGRGRRNVTMKRKIGMKCENYVEGERKTRRGTKYAKYVDGERKIK